MGFQIQAVAFDDRCEIPRRHTREGRGVSPALCWHDVPTGTRAFALICANVDGIGGERVLWLLYDLPPRITELPAGLPERPALTNGAKHGSNSWGELGYHAPLPPRGCGVHHYTFRLYALSQPTGLAPGATHEQLLDAIERTTLGNVHLHAVCERD